MIVGVVFAGARLDGIVTARVRRDGANATEAMARMIGGCRFSAHLQLVMLQGIAVAGFNVVDPFRLHSLTRLPVIVVARRRPDLLSMREALLTRVRGGDRKWRIIERAGPMERVGSLWIQRAGLEPAEAAAVLERFSIHSTVPEPLRVAHIVAGALERGESRGRV